MSPKMLILDEPTTCLDEDACERIARTLLGCGLPYIVAAHGMSFLDLVAPERAKMERGKVVSLSPAEDSEVRRQMGD